MKPILLSLCCLVLVGPRVLSAQTVPAAPATTPAADDVEADKPVKVSEMVKKVKKENDDAAKRIAEIDKAVNPVMEEEAVKLYGIKAEEFRFLRMQAEGGGNADFFGKQRQLDRTNIEGVIFYFDEAYSAIKSGQFWYGREESLVPEDAGLYQKIKQDVLTSLSKRPDGAKILSMLAERDALKAALTKNLPLYKYLSERREWWKFYPDYMEQVKTDYDGKSKNPGTGNSSGTGGGAAPGNSP